MVCIEIIFIKQLLMNNYTNKSFVEWKTVAYNSNILAEFNDEMSTTRAK